jgi:hypothetical protein
MRGVREVAIVMDAGPWSSYGRVRARYPESDERILLLPFSDKAGVESSYQSKQEVIYGPLWTHAAERYTVDEQNMAVDPQVKAERILKRSPLLGAVLGIIADAWGKRVVELAGQRWSRRTHEGDLCVVLQR